MPEILSFNAFTFDAGDVPHALKMKNVVQAAYDYYVKDPDDELWCYISTIYDDEEPIEGYLNGYTATDALFFQTIVHTDLEGARFHTEIPYAEITKFQPYRFVPHS